MPRRDRSPRSESTVILAVMIAVVFLFFFFGTVVHFMQKDGQAKDAVTAGSQVPAPVHHGDPKAIVEGFDQRVKGQFEALHKEAEASLQAMGWSKLLDPDRIKADPDFSKSQAILDQAQKLIVDYRGRRNQTIAAIPGEIERLDLSESDKQYVLQNFRSSLGAIMDHFDAIWAADDEILRETADVLSLLNEIKGQWRVVNHKFVFRNQAELDAFNGRLKDIRDSIAEAKRLDAGGAPRTASEELERAAGESSSP